MQKFSTEDIFGKSEENVSEVFFLQKYDWDFPAPELLKRCNTRVFSTLSFGIHHSELIAF